MPKKVFDIFPPRTKESIQIESEIAPLSQIKKKKRTKLKFFLLIVLILVLTTAIFHFVLSEVRIEIWPETQFLNYQEKITAQIGKTSVDAVNKIIPAEIVEIEKTSSPQEFPASGKILKEEKAKGKIKVFNNYNLAQTLAANTRFQPPLEKVLYFRLTKTVVVPAKSTLEVDVVADRPGEEYNIEPATFSIPGLAGLPQYYSIYGKSSEKMEGGFQGEVPKVTNEDLERAKRIVVEKLSLETKESLKNQVSVDSILLDGATKEEILETSSSVEADKEAQAFNFQAKIKLIALVFKKGDIEKFSQEFIVKQIPENKKIQDNSLQTKYSSESIDFENGKILINADFSAKTYSNLDLTLLKEVLRNKLLKEAKVILETQPQVKRVEVTPWPFWINRIPENIDEIKFKLNID